MPVQMQQSDTHGEDGETDGGREECLGRTVSQEPGWITCTFVQQSRGFWEGCHAPGGEVRLQFNSFLSAA